MKNKNYTCSKVFGPYPFAHRQHNHSGHCSLIHGHNWSFKLTFSSPALDINGFVHDFGANKELRDWLTKTFDHTLVLNLADPYLHVFEDALESKGMALIIRVPSGSAEGLAEYVFMQANAILKRNKVKALVIEVECREDDRNSATYKA